MALYLAVIIRHSRHHLCLLNAGRKTTEVSNTTFLINVRNNFNS